MGGLFSDSTIAMMKAYNDPSNRRSRDRREGDGHLALASEKVYFVFNPQTDTMRIAGWVHHENPRLHRLHPPPIVPPSASLVVKAG